MGMAMGEAVACGDTAEGWDCSEYSVVENIGFEGLSKGYGCGHMRDVRVVRMVQSQQTILDAICL